MTEKAPETAAQKKLRAVRITASARFNAAHRLRTHAAVSLLSISLCSLAVVVISMLSPFGVVLAVPQSAADLAAAAISLLILVVSLLISGRKYGERAEKMHSCAVEINAVGRKLEAAVESGDTTEIERLADCYEEILRANENHKDPDYRAAQIQRYATHYKVGKKKRIRSWLELKLDAWIHALPMLITAAVLYFLLKGASLSPDPASAQQCHAADHFSATPSATLQSGG